MFGPVHPGVEGLSPGVTRSHERSKSNSDGFTWIRPLKQKPVWRPTLPHDRPTDRLPLGATWRNGRPVGANPRRSSGFQRKQYTQTWTLQQAVRGLLDPNRSQLVTCRRALVPGPFFRGVLAGGPLVVGWGETSQVTPT